MNNLKRHSVVPKKKSIGHPFRYSQLNILLYVYQCKNRKEKKIDKQNMI